LLTLNIIETDAPKVLRKIPGSRYDASREEANYREYHRRKKKPRRDRQGWTRHEILIKKANQLFYGQAAIKRQSRYDRVNLLG